MKKYKEISKILTRPNKLPILEAASIGFWKELPELTGFSYSVSALVFKNNIVNVYRNKEESKQLLFKHLLKKIRKSPNFIPTFEKNFKNWIIQIRKLLNLNKKNLSNKEIIKIIKDFHHFYQKAWAGVIVVMWLPQVAEEVKGLKKEFLSVIKKTVKLRKQSEGLLGWGTDFYQEILDRIVQESKISVDLSDNLKVKEIINYFQSKRLPSKQLLRQRKKGCVLLNDRFYFLRGKSIKEFFKEKGYKIAEDKVEKEVKIIRGSTAYIGKAKGKIRFLPHHREINKFQTGEVLVAPMTTPQYLPAMKKAAAIITDEGGITCHAAIVSRELKIPCVVGTKIATKVLKDGDFVEVDADKGIVKIIKKAK